MSGWNFADVWEIVADQIPDAPAQVQGDRTVTWRQFERRADGVARTLIERGVAEQDKVAQYLYNCPEYLESIFASFKAGLVPINTNYRYTDDELVYLWDNADCTAVVFHGTFAEVIDRIRAKVPRVQTWLWVDDGAGPCPDWALPYEEAAAAAEDDQHTSGPWGRSGDQLLLLYTGGTTGMPKGVMWPQDTLFRAIVGAIVPEVAESEGEDLDFIRQRVQTPGMVGVPACPLMHGTGMFTQLILLSTGGSTVLLVSRHLDIEELLDTIQERGVNQMAIVGDAFAKPILRALDANPGRWDISSLVAISSSGVMWSEESKQKLLQYNPTMLLLDAFSSSEALGMGQSTAAAGADVHTAKFVLGPNARVIDDAGNDVVPGSGQVGRVAVGGNQPIGYYKDKAKTESTFLTIDGKTYVVPGDYAMLNTDGTMTLLGRGSVCINTGGEKVYPEEVEEVLKLYPGVSDAVAVGVPDEKFGEAVAAVVEPSGEGEVEPDELIRFVRSKLAAYKAPKRVVLVDTIGRAPNGKVDYKRLKTEARERLGV